MKYVMYEHGGSGNHGCEAIVRSTVKMLDGNNKFYLQTANAFEDKENGVDQLATLIEYQSGIVNRNSPIGLGLRLFSRLNPKMDYDIRESIYKHRELLIKDSIAMSIGGDNYCYAGIIGSMRDKLIALKAKKIPTVLWGCSIGPEYLDKKTIEDLKKYDLITARDTITADLLDHIGIRDNVVLCSDPAFTLSVSPVKKFDELFRKNRVIGMNISGFMKHYNAYPDATYKNFISVINYILKNTEYDIVFIPHVVQSGNNDLAVCNDLAGVFNSERIIVINDKLNCMQLKYIISKCSLFIGCRTHSTIAAYSTNVPTLVVGYSVKAVGIAEDIFGRTDNLLVDVRNFKTDNDLLNTFISFYEMSATIKDELKVSMPQYIERAYLAKDAVLSL